MKRLTFVFDSCAESRFTVPKCLIIKLYIWIELCIWCFMSYSSIYHGKIFDYNNMQTEKFVEHLTDGAEAGGNWYYRLMFGNLNLTNIDFENQRNVQEKCDTLNTLFVFVFGLYFILSMFFLIGMSKTLGTKCLLCPYVSFDLSVLTSVIIFTIYGALKNIETLNRNGSFFILIKLLPSSTIFSYYRKLVA